MPRQAYRAVVADGIPPGPPPRPQGSGLVRSLGGWAVGQRLRRGREAYLGDERILGSPVFVETLRRAAAVDGSPRPARVPLDALVARVCRHVGLAPAALHGGGRRLAVQQARAGIAYLWTAVLGHPGRPLAPVLGTQPAAVLKAAQRGARAAAVWRQVLGKVS